MTDGDGGRADRGRPVVLFDIDDTLFDHRRALRAALGAIRREEPAFRRRRLSDLVGQYERLLDQIVPDIRAGISTHQDARRERFRRLYAWAGAERSTAELSEIANRYRSAYQAARYPVPGSPELLRWLRPRATVGAVSNNHAEEQADKLAALGMTDLLDFVVTSEEVGVGKPDPAIFRHALSLARARPEQAVMVGDTWSTDVVGAQRFGLRVVWLNRTGASPPGERGMVEEIDSLRPTADLGRRLLRPGAPPTGAA